MRTCRSKALISRHLSMTFSSSFGKLIDILGRILSQKSDVYAIKKNSVWW